MAAQTAGSYARSVGQRPEIIESSGNESIARVFALHNGRQLELRLQLRGNIFKAMHRKIHLVSGQRLFYLFGEHSFGADLGERHLGDFVASSFDDFNFYGMSLRLQQGRHMIGLPEREL